jgi:hypothetical protein
MRSQLAEGTFLLAIVGSSGDSMSDEETLDALQHMNN